MDAQVLRKFLSAVLSAAVAAGVMVMLLDEGPLETPYYQGAWANPVNTPRLEAFEPSDARPEAEPLEPQAEEVPADSANGVAFEAEPAGEEMPPQSPSEEGRGEDAPVPDPSPASGYTSRAQ